MRPHQTSSPAAESPLPYALILTTDEQFSAGFLTTLGSALIGSDLGNFSIYVGNTGAAPLGATWRSALELCRRFNFPCERCRQLQVDLTPAKELDPMSDGSHHSYARWQIASQLDEPVIVSLDADTLVTGDLSQLARALPEGAPIAAVRDRFQLTHAKDLYTIEGQAPTPDAAYFNAGVFVLNNRDFDNRHFVPTFVALQRRVSNLRFSDQSLANILYKNRWAHLPPEWNRLTMTNRPAGLDVEGRPTRLLHFVGMEKPWNSTTIDLPNIFWHCVAEALDVPIDPARVEEQHAAIDAYLRLSRRKLRLQKFWLRCKRSKRRKIDRIQHLLDLPRDLQIIEDWLLRHGLGPLPPRFRRLRNDLVQQGIE